MKYTQKMLKFYFIIFSFVCYVHGSFDWSKDMNGNKWRLEAKNNIQKRLNRKQNRNIAKNLILFIGDGMGISTVTAGRILKGQKKNQNGEEEITFMESLDDVAYSKTYNIDAQTADSAGTATAYLSGVKTRIGVIGLDGKTIYEDCESSKNSKVDSIARWAHNAGKSVGMITTTRITHASPSAIYAHSPSRDWEVYDGKVFNKSHYDQGCRDIASQLIDNATYINLIFGGGRSFFLPKTTVDYSKRMNGTRIDGRNLIDDWEKKMQKDSKSYKFLWNNTDFRNLEIDKYDHILGLFAHGHMEYEAKRKNSDQPSIVEMTEKAIQILSRNPKGFFLFVEGGRIDHGHHESKPFYALNDFVAFDDAIGQAKMSTSSNETLIVVSADHSHTFTFGGYSLRGNDILGLVYNYDGNVSNSNLTYTSIGYANGPGGGKLRLKNLTDAEVAKPDYITESAVFMKSETHGGEDVPIYANGPMSFLFTGTVEQNYIPHAMAYAACIGLNYNDDNCARERGSREVQYNSAYQIRIFHNLTFLLIISLIKRLVV